MQRIYSKTEVILNELGTAPNEGLTAQQVLASRQQYGSNHITPPKRDPWWRLYLDTFKDPTIIILSGAAMIAIALSLLQGEFPLDGLAIFVAVFIATGVAFLNEYKAGQDFEDLLQSAEDVLVKVIRNGQFQTLSINELVIGDLIDLQVGDRIPADGQLLYGVSLLVDESLMTGEALPVHKGAHNTLLQRGTAIVEGDGRAVVTAIGDQTEMGKIASALVEEEEKTPLQENLGEIADLINKVGTAVAVAILAALSINAIFTHLLFTSLTSGLKIGIAAFIMLVGVVACWRLVKAEEDRTVLLTSLIAPSLLIVAMLAAMMASDQGITVAGLSLMVDFFIVAVTIVVVAVPEGLPMAVTVSLARSMQKLTQDNILVRKLIATETIGAANIICSDKTGTLTKNQMSVEQVYVHGQRFSGQEALQLQNHAAFERLALGSTVNSVANLEQKDGQIRFVGNPTECALLDWMRKQEVEYDAWRTEIPFSERVVFTPERKMMSTLVEHNRQPILLTKGAPERVLARCTKIEIAGGVHSIEAYLPQLSEQLESMTSEALRPLALAYKTSPATRAANEETVEEKDLTLLALVGIGDPMREEVPAAIKTCHEAGIEVKMVTGDNLKTATVLAQQLGLLKGEPIVVDHLFLPSEHMTAAEVETLVTQYVNRNDKAPIVLEGEVFRKMTEGTAPDKVSDGIKDIVQRLRVLARSSPLDKLTLVQILKAQRQVVAVTGDGTNDAPALRQADVGLSMGLIGTDVAKEASDIVLLDDSFTSIERAVQWGRALFENIRKFLQFQLTINVSALAIAFLSPLLNIFLEPLLGIQLMDRPLTVLQLLWINLIMDTLAVLALVLDPPTPDLMQRPPRGRGEAFITPLMGKNILLMSGYFTIALIALQLFDFLGGSTLGSAEHASVLFTTYVFFQIFNEFNCRSLEPKRSPFEGLRESKPFWVIIVITALVQILLTQAGGAIGEAFNTVPLPLWTWLKLILFTSSALLLGELIRLYRVRNENTVKTTTETREPLLAST